MSGPATVTKPEEPMLGCKPWLHRVLEGAAFCQCGRIGVERSGGFVILPAPPEPATVTVEREAEKS